MMQRLYDRTIRERLPRTIGILNGVRARKPRLLDVTKEVPDYEAELVDALEATVEPNDHVVVVGGGLGVTSVVAARRGQRVTTYEAGRDRFERLRETLKINGVADRVEAHHALVGPKINVNGECAERAIAPDELPACDVLEIDAEGSEVGILKGIAQRPRVIIVECHAHRGAPVDDVTDLLDRLEYEVVDEDAECREKGIVILTAVRT